MKLIKGLSTSIVCIIISVIFFACKKKSNGEDCIYGGVYQANKYVFWIDHDFGCGYITVEITSGQNPMKLGTAVKMWDSFAPGCSDAEYINHTGFLLDPGVTYTYKATCTGKTWTGTIDVPCVFGACYAIQLK